MREVVSRELPENIVHVNSISEYPNDKVYGVEFNDGNFGVIQKQVQPNGPDDYQYIVLVVENINKRFEYQHNKSKRQLVQSLICQGHRVFEFESTKEYYKWAINHI